VRHEVADDLLGDVQVAFEPTIASDGASKITMWYEPSRCGPMAYAESASSPGADLDDLATEPMIDRVARSIAA
jgi:hypothetical protein